MLAAFEHARGFIFDCDGTLLDSMKTWRQVEDELIQMAGGHISDEDFVELQAVDIHDGARLLHERYGAGKTAEAIIGYVDGRLLDFYRNAVEPCEGAVEFVRALCERGIACSVVSASPMRFVRAGLARCGIIDAFDAVISTETAKLSKKEGAIYRLAVREMGARIDECWGVDDSLYALRAMKTAGLRTVGAYEDDKAGSFEELTATADVAVHTLAELLDE